MRTDELLMCVSAMWLCGCTTFSPHGVRNFEQVEPWVFRGGQPTPDGWRFLVVDQRVRVVVKLDEEHEGSDDYAAALGAKVIKFPISVRQQLGIDPIDMEAMMFIAAEAPRTGLYFHCLRGQDRTGLFGAVRRVVVDGWTKGQAEREMLDCGFHKDLLPGLWAAWKGWEP